MSDEPRTAIRDLIDRLGRLSAAEEWAHRLNPAQRAALAYLGRANQVSRAPSHVAEFLATTRGTASQTLKTLERKGFIKAERSAADRRSIRYDVTREGSEALRLTDELDAAIAALAPDAARSLEAGLFLVARAALTRRNQRSFGVCRSCRHHRATETGGFCELLNVALSLEDASQLCHEHAQL
ncbi:MAG: MarR family transcriptional regulator [Pseudomonadota bacterium]